MIKKPQTNKTKANQKKHQISHPMTISITMKPNCIKLIIGKEFLQPAMGT